MAQNILNNFTCEKENAWKTLQPAEPKEDLAEVPFNRASTRGRIHLSYDFALLEYFDSF